MDQTPNPYRVSLAALEDSAHVEVEDMVTEQAEPAAPDALGPDEMARLSMLRLGGAGI